MRLRYLGPAPMLIAALIGFTIVVGVAAGAVLLAIT